MPAFRSRKCSPSEVCRPGRTDEALKAGVIGASNGAGDNAEASGLCGKVDHHGLLLSSVRISAGAESFLRYPR